MVDQGSINRLIKKYRERLDYLEETYKDKKYHKYLDERLKQKHPDRSYSDFGDWLNRIEKRYKHDLREKEGEYLFYGFLRFERHDITLFYNDIKELQGEKPYSRKVYESMKNWNKPYLKREIGLPVDKDNDFYSVDITYIFKSTTTPEEATEIINSNIKQFRHDSLDATCHKLQSNKKYKGISMNFLQIKKVIYRSNFKELRITVGLKDSILKLKEEMQEEMNERNLI